MDFLSGKASGNADVRVVVQDHQDHQPFMVF